MPLSTGSSARRRLSRCLAGVSAAVGVIAAVALPAGAAVRPHATATVDIALVPVGDAGNHPDTRVMDDGTTGYGAVAHAYRIGEYHVTNAEYVAFLNAKASSDPVLLYDPLMNRANGLHLGSGIDQHGTPGSYTYTVEDRRSRWPVNYVSVFDAMRMANWLQNGQGNGDTETGAYTLLGGLDEPLNAATVVRNPNAKYFLPTEDEWYKAAFFSPKTHTYFFSPTGTNTPIVCAKPGPTPNTANCNGQAGNDGVGGGAFTNVGAYTASASPYGTFDQGGIDFEYTETLTSLPPSCLAGCVPPPPGYAGPYRILRGSSYVDAASWVQASGRGSITAETEFAAQGFRLAAAALPEPATAPVEAPAAAPAPANRLAADRPTVTSPGGSLAATGLGVDAPLTAVALFVTAAIVRRRPPRPFLGREDTDRHRRAGGGRTGGRARPRRRGSRRSGLRTSRVDQSVQNLSTRGRIAGDGVEGVRVSRAARCATPGPRAASSCAGFVR